jgi:PPP family 3-phenylpropionic acid transporter
MNTAKRETKRNYTLFIVLYFLIYMGDVPGGTYLPLYLRSIGLGEASIGAILAIAPMVAMATQPLWGMATDASRSKNAVLITMLGGATLFFFLIPYVPSSSLPILLGVIILYNVFRSSTHGITDAISLEYLDSIDGKYGPVRMSGTLGYAVMAIIVGAVATRKLTNVFWVFAIPTVMAMALLLMVPTVKGHYHKGSTVNFLTLFKQRELMMLTAIGLLFQSTSGFFHSFFSIYFINDLGGSLQLLGIITSFSAFAEIPFLIFSDSLVKKFGIRALLLVACFVGAIRWILTALVVVPELQFFVQLLHGMNSIVFMFCMAVYINQSVPRELKASGQAFYAFFVGIGSRVIGSWIGGILTTHISKQLIFLTNGLLLLGVLLLIVIKLRTSRGAQYNEPIRIQGGVE